MLPNTPGACLTPRCTDGALESLEARPPRPIPHRDREDTGDLAEETPPRLPGNEHPLLNVQCSSHRFSLSVSGVNDHAPTRTAHLASPCAPAPTRHCTTTHVQAFLEMPSTPQLD